MLVDANILLYAANSSSRFHAPAEKWLVEALNGNRRVGLPWQSLWAFLRISTNSRVLDAPLTALQAWEHIDDWLAAPAAWIPEPGRGHGSILRDLVVTKDLRGGLVSDAALAALCIEHGLTIVSADSDFARFPEIERLNPIQ